MEEFSRACRALFETAFAESPASWNDAFFAMAPPHYLRAIRQGDRPLAMLFSIPYALKTEQGTVDARYLFGVATDPAHRGKGLATRLIRTVIDEGHPVFLRPSSPSLFSCYERAGLSPLSPHAEAEGVAAGDIAGIRYLSKEEYLIAREAFLDKPFVRPDADFLSLGFLYGGALSLAGKFAAFYERIEDGVYFKEWLGSTEYAPRAAAFLGAAHYRLRTPHAGGAPFGMGAGCPADTAFLIALD